jgi:hypothetical protein
MTIRFFLKVTLFTAIGWASACTSTSEDILPDTAEALQTATEELLAFSTDTAHQGGCSGLGRGQRHGFGNSGNGRFNHPILRGDSIGYADLPQITQVYINANRGGVANVVRVMRFTLPDGTVAYGVRFSDGTHLHFDATGNLRVLTDHGRRNFRTTTFDSLPNAAKTYLLANTDTAQIVHIMVFTKPDGTVTYGVRLRDGRHLAFDINGVLLPEPTRRRGRGRR